MENNDYQLWIIASARTADEEYERSKNEDFEQFDEKEYIELFETTTTFIDEGYFRKAENFRDAINTARGRITNIVNGDSSHFRHSALRKWALKVLDEVDASLFPDPTKKIRRKSVSGIASTDMWLNQKIITLFGESVTLNEILIKIKKFLDDNPNNLDLVNIKTILYNLLKATKDPKKRPREIRAIRELLFELAFRISEDDGEFLPDEICRELYNLKNLNSSMVPRVLLQMFSEKMRQLKQPLSAKNIGSALYGLQNLDKSEVPINLLFTLAQKINQTNAKLDAQAIGNALYGLKNLDSWVVPMELLQALAWKIDQPGVELDAQAIGNALYGLKNMDNMVVPMELLQALAQKIDQPGVELNAQAIGNALYGLQNLDSMVVPIELMQTLAQKIDQAGIELDAQSIGNALYGIVGLQDISAAQDIKKRLIDSLEKLKGQKLNDTDIKYLTQVLHLHGVPIPKWLWQSYDKFVIENNEKPNWTEKEALEFFRKRYPREIVLSNQYIDGFELDIFFPKRRVNIEIDGMSHRHRGKRCKRRDKYLLEEKRISTIRVDIVENNLREALEQLKLEF